MRIKQTTHLAASAICTLAADADLVIPPASAGPNYGAVPSNWETAGGRVVAKFDLRLRSPGAVAGTNLAIYGAMPTALVSANDDVDTVDFANDELDIAAHAYTDGYGPVQLTTTGTLPAGLSLLTNYYIIVVGAGTIQLALTRSDALAGTAVAFTDVGAGVHTVVAESDATFLDWASLGKLGDAKDGVVNLASQKSYLTRVLHDAEITHYAIGGDIDALTLTADVRAVLED